MTVCHKCKHHRFGDKGVADIRHVVWYNQFCSAVRFGGGPDWVIGRAEPARMAYCRDVNTDGMCIHFEEGR